MSDAQRKEVFGDPGANKQSIDMCVVLAKAGFQIGTTTCSDATTGAVGVCYGNINYKAEQAKKNTAGGAIMFGTTKACTKATSGTGGGSSFVSSTEVEVPSWKVSSAASGSTLSGFSAATIKASAETKAASSGNTELLKGALLMAAVEISNDPVAKDIMDPAKAPAGVNLTASLGVSEAQFASLKQAVATSTDFSVAQLDPSSGVAPTGDFATQLTDSKTALTTAVGASLVNESPSTGGGSTSAATAMMVGSSVVLGMVSMLF
jgi:hypothetical protein